MLPDTDEIPIVVSIAYYVFFLSMGSALRFLIRRNIAEPSRTYWLDLVTTFSVLACSLENSHVRQHYGYGAYVTVLYILCSWHFYTLHDSSANPINNVVFYAQGRYSLGRVAWLTTAQILGAVLSYQAASIFWSLGLCRNHRMRYKAVDCKTDMSVSLPVGFLIESAGSAFDVFLGLSVFTKVLLIDVAVKCLVMCLLTAALVSLTGFYINPMNASNQSFGCSGTSVHEHLLVYWIGPCLFAYLMTHAHQKVFSD